MWKRCSKYSRVVPVNEPPVKHGIHADWTEISSYELMNKGGTAIIRPLHSDGMQRVFFAHLAERKICFATARAHKSQLSRLLNLGNSQKCI